MATRKRYKTGDIVMVELGNPEQGTSIGSEQAFKRPCVIIHPINNKLQMAVIVPFTSNTSPSIPRQYYVPVKASKGGLEKDSCALCHQVRSISYERILGHLGKLPEEQLNEILTVLADLLGGV